jgi:hypothetical protein
LFPESQERLEERLLGTALLHGNPFMPLFMLDHRFADAYEFRLVPKNLHGPAQI